MSGKNPALNLSLAFDDVLLTPDYSDCLPADVSVVSQLTKTLTLGAPLLSAAMDTVTEWRMAVEMAKSGGMGVIHKNLDITRQAEQVSAVKRFESGVITKPYVVSSAMTVSQTLRFKEKHGISGLPVVDGKGRVAGIVTNRDLRFERSLNAPITKVMTPREKLITVSPKTKLATAKALMHKHRIERVIIEDSQRRLCGLITVKDIILAEQYPQACKDAKGRLRVAAAIGIVKDGRADSVVEAGADAIVIDTAHGHSKGVLEALLRVRKRHKKICIIAGNVATPQGALMLSQAGADVIKVGIGPGSICTTRIIAGVGVPQFSAIANVAAAFRRRHRPGIIADGGIRHSGDIVKAVAAGADAVMIGGILAGSEESPGAVELYQGRLYKNYRGMGSLGAMQDGSADRYFQENRAKEKLVPEGVEGRVPYRGAAKEIIAQLIGGLRSAMGYTGNRDISSLHKRAKFIHITSAGVVESHVHDVQMTKETTNYPSA